MNPIFLIPVGIIVFVALIVIYCAFAWYRVVPKSEAHVVVTPSKTKVCSGNPEYAKNGGSSTYYAIPKIPFIGRDIRIMDVTTKDLVITQETIERGQARYRVKSSTKYRITDVDIAAERTSNQKELEEQLSVIVQAGIRVVTIQYDLPTARAKKGELEQKIREQIESDFKEWGISLVNIQLINFSDTDDSTIVSDISKIREVEINSDAREQNAERRKKADIKEAEADEASKQRQIERDQKVGEYEENKKKAIAEKMKLAEEERYKVVQVQTIKQAEIDKEKAIVEANQSKETELIKKEQKKLEGEGDKLRAMEKAKGEAAPIREKGLAEAEAKDKLQAALNKFKDEAIRALVAEKIVEKDKEVGIKAAEALANAEVKAFLGGGAEGQEAFNVGKALEGLTVSSNSAADSVLHRIKVPNDLGGGIPITTKEKKTKTKKQG